MKTNIYAENIDEAFFAIQEIYEREDADFAEWYQTLYFPNLDMEKILILYARCIFQFNKDLLFQIKDNGEYEDFRFEYHPTLSLNGLKEVIQKKIEED